MKNIELKARHKRTGKIVNGSYNSDDYECGILGICLDGGLLDSSIDGFNWVDDYQLVMYTGKKDVNGDKIYQDIEVCERDD